MVYNLFKVGSGFLWLETALKTKRGYSKSKLYTNRRRWPQNEAENHF